MHHRQNFARKAPNPPLRGCNTKRRRLRSALCSYNLGMSERRFPPPWTVEAIGDGRGETRCYVPLRHCAFSHGAVLLKPFWTGPPHVVQLRSIVIEYFSEEGVFRLQNPGPEPARGWCALRVGKCTKRSDLAAHRPRGLPYMSGTIPSQW